MTEEETKTLEEVIARHATRPGALLVVAEALLDRFRYIPPAALPVLARRLRLPPAEVHSVLSYYRYPIRERPVRCEVEVCHALTCHMKSGGLLPALLDAFGAGRDTVSADGRLLITTAHCLSACDAPPAMAVNGVIHTGLTPPQAIALVRRALA
jgi:formate dehydrogenase subunit gamma